MSDRESPGGAVVVVVHYSSAQLTRDMSTCLQINDQQLLAGAHCGV